MIDIVFEPIAKFFGTHAKFIIGVIVNIILIWGTSTLIDVFSSRVEKKITVKKLGLSAFKPPAGSV